jgi:hypothetical protein
VATALTEFVHWLAETPVSHLIRNELWIIPTVQTLHILGIAAVIGSTMLMDLRVLGVAIRGQSLASVVERLSPWLWRALLLLFITGSILVIGEPGRSLVNPLFQIKMALLVVAIVLTLLMRAGLAPTLRQGGDSAPATAKMLALILILVWIAIVFAGRWIAYGDVLLGTD